METMTPRARGPSPPQPRNRRAPAARPGTDRTTGEGSWLRCRACRAPIAAEGDRVAVEGRHVHRRANPMGLAFVFGCFAEAPGAAAVGDATAEHTWFAGFRWSVALCRGCAGHLGWTFRGEGSAFVGLILDRLES